MIHATEADIKRFMSYVDKLPNGCWYWTGGRSRGKGNRKWYGTFRVGKRSVRAHRFSSEVLNGDECPEGYDRDHKCCFSMCVNPAHIKVVTKARNQQLKMERLKCMTSSLSVEGYLVLWPLLTSVRAAWMSSSWTTVDPVLVLGLPDA